MKLNIPPTTTTAAGIEPRVEPKPPTAPAVKPTLWVTPWPDAVIDELGHDPRSRYVEKFWLGALGPSTTWLLRLFAHEFDSQPHGFNLELEPAAKSLGLGMKGGRHSPFVRAIDRICQFSLGERTADEALKVRRRIPPMTQGQVRRLPSRLRNDHQAWQQGLLECGDLEAERHARRLALALLEVGQDLEEARHQLLAWNQADTVVDRALTWAHLRHARASEAAPGPEAA